MALVCGFMYSGAATVALAADVLRAPASTPTGMSLMTPVWMTIAIGLLAGCGYAIVVPLTREMRLYWHERWSAAWLIGCGVGACAWFVMMPLYGWITPIWLLTAVLGGVTAVVAVRGGRAEALRYQTSSRIQALRYQTSSRNQVAQGFSPASRSDDHWSVVDVALAVVLMFQVAVLFLIAFRTPLGWDGLYNFEIKARLAFEHTPVGQLPLAYFSDPAQKASHPHYPLLVPFTEFWVYTWLGRIDQSAVKVLFPVFYLSLIGFVAGVVRRIANRRAATIAAIALGSLPPLTLIPGAASGYADVPLAAAVAGAISFALVGIAQTRRDAFALSAALLAVAVWTKSEGLLFALAIGAFAVALKPVAVSMWSIPLFAGLPWTAFQFIFGQPGGDFQSVSASIFVENLHRLPTIAMLVARELVRPGHWALLFPVFFCLLAVAVKRRASAVDLLLAAIVVVPLAAYGLMYVFSAWPDMREHVGTSLSRVLVPVAPLALIFIARQLAGLKPGATYVEARKWA
jgi:hypothetical protein